MNLDALIKKLLTVAEPEGTILTLSLDLAGTGTLPQATRIFLKDEVADNLSSAARPERARAVLKKLARRVTSLIESGLQPGSKGLYLAAGKDLWSPVEFKVRTRNFLTTGPRPFLPPLLAVAARAPRSYLVGIGSRGVEIREYHLGESRILTDQAALEIADNREHVHWGRSGLRASSGSGGGGGERDRRQQRENAAFHGLVRGAAKQVRDLLGRAPAQSILLAGPRDIQGDFERHLPAEWSGRVRYLGLMDDDLNERALSALREEGTGRTEAELLEFHECRAEGGKVALGPHEVLQALWSGRASHVYLDEFDPIPGVVCTGCGVHRPGLELRCPFCGEEVKATSIAQDVVTYALTHSPSVGLRFTGPEAGWLREAGGVAALLAVKGARPRTAAPLK